MPTKQLTHAPTGSFLVNEGGVSAAASLVLDFLRAADFSAVVESLPDEQLEEADLEGVELDEGAPKDYAVGYAPGRLVAERVDTGDLAEMFADYLDAHEDEDSVRTKAGLASLRETLFGEATDGEGDEEDDSVDEAKKGKKKAKKGGTVWRTLNKRGPVPVVRGRDFSESSFREAVNDVNVREALTAMLMDVLRESEVYVGDLFEYAKEKGSAKMRRLRTRKKAKTGEQRRALVTRRREYKRNVGAKRVAAKWRRRHGKRSAALNSSAEDETVLSSGLRGETVTEADRLVVGFGFGIGDVGMPGMDFEARLREGVTVATVDAPEPVTETEEVNTDTQVDEGASRAASLLTLG